MKGGREEIVPSAESLPGPFWLDDDVLRMRDGVWRPGGLNCAGGRHGEHEKLSRGSADGIQMVAVIPEKLINLVAGEQAGIGGDGVAAVEVEDLQPCRSADSQQLA